MRTHILTLLAAFAVVSAQAAVWERPAGAYTPTNNSVNTTKYQQDRANGVFISEVKVDGDFNKAFQGLNDLESRTAPSVVGQSGRFLTNNGAATSWGLVSPSSISSGAATAGQVLKATGTGAGLFGLLDASSFANAGVAGTYTAPTLTLNTAGMVTSITTPLTISTTNLYASGTATVSGTLSAGTISTTALTGPQTRGFAKAWAVIDGTTGSLLSSYNVSSTSKSGGEYTVNLSTPMASSNYVVLSNCGNNGGNSINCPLRSIDNTSTFRVWTLNGTSAASNATVVMVTVFGL